MNITAFFVRKRLGRSFSKGAKAATIIAKNGEVWVRGKANSAGDYKLDLGGLKDSFKVPDASSLFSSYKIVIQGAGGGKPHPAIVHHSDDRVVAFTSTTCGRADFKSNALSGLSHRKPLALISNASGVFSIEAQVLSTQTQSILFYDRRPLNRFQRHAVNLGLSAATKPCGWSNVGGKRVLSDLDTSNPISYACTLHEEYALAWAGVYAQQLRTLSGLERLHRSAALIAAMSDAGHCTVELPPMHPLD